MSLAYSSAPVKQIREVQFGILSPEDIVSLAMVARLSAPPLV
jgi:hypothetical protein